MKIYQFPAQLLPSGSQDIKTSKKNAAASTDFASILEATKQKNDNLCGSGKIVSQENQRALNLPAASEMGMAEKLIGFLHNDIMSSSPEMLRSVHDLEGLVYVYSKNKSND